MVETTEETLIERGSGNVYADIGMPDAEEMLAKAKLVHAIGKTLKARGLTQDAAAQIMGIDQPQVCAAHDETRRPLWRTLRQWLSEKSLPALPPTRLPPMPTNGLWTS